MTDSPHTPPVPRALDLAAAWAWRLVVVAFGVVTIAVVLYELRIVMVPVFVALLVSTLFIPPVRYLQSRGLGAAPATALVYLTVAACAAIGIYLLASPVASQFNDLGPQLQGGIDKMQNWLTTGPLELSQADLDKYIQQARESVQANSSGLQSGLITSATLVGEVITGILLTLILSFFFVKDGDHLAAAVINRFPLRHRSVANRSAQRAFHILGGYLRGVAMTGVVDAVLIGIALVVIGVPLVLPLVILTFFGAFFPVVGATVAGVLAALVALVNGGPVDALFVLIAVIVVQQVEGHLLQPLLVGRAVRLHPVVILVSLVSGTIVAGLLGAFLAVPIVAVITGVTREIEGERPAEVSV